MANTLDPMYLKQIITLHLDGLSNRKIGTTLGISRNTVNSYMRLFRASDHSFKELSAPDNASPSLPLPPSTICVTGSSYAILKEATRRGTIPALHFYLIIRNTCNWQKSLMAIPSSWNISTFFNNADLTI